MPSSASGFEPVERRLVHLVELDGSARSVSRARRAAAVASAGRDDLAVAIGLRADERAVRSLFAEVLGSVSVGRAPVIIGELMAGLARRGRACGGTVTWTDEPIRPLGGWRDSSAPLVHAGETALGARWTRLPDRVTRRGRAIVPPAPVAMVGGNDREAMRATVRASDTTMVIGLIGRASPRVVLTALHGAGLAHLAGADVRLVVSPEARRSTRPLESRFRLDGLVSEGPAWDAAALAPALDVAIVPVETRPRGNSAPGSIVASLFARGVERGGATDPLVCLDAGAGGATVIDPAFAHAIGDHAANAEGRRLGADLLEVHRRGERMARQPLDADVLRDAEWGWGRAARSAVLGLLDDAESSRASA